MHLPALLKALLGSLSILLLFWVFTLVGPMFSSFSFTESELSSVGEIEIVESNTPLSEPTGSETNTDPREELDEPLFNESVDVPDTSETLSDEHDAPPVTVTPKATDPAEEGIPVTVIAPVETVPPQPLPLTVSNSQFAILAQNARSVIVNLYCSTREGNTIRTVTGSGVVINNRGVILTNAHVAQQFLLKDYPTQGATVCIIRGGNPARALYNAKLLYLPPVWIDENASSITIESPFGTGEHDYAFLLITEGVFQGQTLPALYPAISMDLGARAVEEAQEVFVSAYPADILDANGVEQDLYNTSDVAAVLDLFTFQTSTLDIFSIDSNIVSQRGSSGGAVINASNELVGLIVTSTDEPVLTERNLRAIIPAYINRDLILQSGVGITALLSGDLLAKATLFETNVAPILTNILVTELNKE